jgi:hypothetical protein
MSWLTGTRGVLDGGMDYIWGVGFLLGVLVLSATGGYTVLERVQMAIVTAMIACAAIILVLYNPDWLELISGVVPSRLSYPPWLAEKYPEIARHSVWVETTRYVGVIGGAGFDYLAYTSWLREKQWGVLPQRANSATLAQMAADPQHEVRRWTIAPMLDSAVSFALVVAFSAVFVASGALILGPNQLVPDEENMLNQQARIFTAVHPWLVPLYVLGAFLTMIGTLYGTLEIACAIADEIVRSFVTGWNRERARRLKRVVVAWCGVLALGILGWLFARQANVFDQPAKSASADALSAGDSRDTSDSSAVQDAPMARPKPRVLLAILTVVNLFTGVLSCGLICFLVLWMDRRYLPRALQPPLWLVGLNLLSGLVFLALGLKGYWDNPHRQRVVAAMFGVLVLTMVIALPLQRKLAGLRGSDQAEE